MLNLLISFILFYFYFLRERERERESMHASGGEVEGEEGRISNRLHVENLKQAPPNVGLTLMTMRS